MKQLLKRAAARVANTRLVRSTVVHLVYPTIVRCMVDEIQPDVPSVSGVLEEFAWKVHSEVVLSEELRLTGVNCCPDGLRSDGETRVRLFESVLAAIGDRAGDILEFGVAGGDSIRYWAKHCPRRQIYGFDSFEGLPEQWWSRPVGAFKADEPQLDAKNVTFVKGLFEDTLPGFVESWTGSAALVHVDCDLFSSTRCCLRAVLPRCSPGTVVLFDEYYNYPVFAEHEWLAWHEAMTTFGMSAHCVGYDGRRAAFQIDEIDTQSVARGTMANGRAIASPVLARV
jgi:hypothetical protein